MPSYNFANVYPEDTHVVGKFGDWDAAETLLLTFSEGARFTDVQLYENVSDNYPSAIPVNATVTAVRVRVTARTGFSTADLRCALTHEGDWTTAKAGSFVVSKGDTHLTFMFSGSALQDFINARGGPEIMNDKSFGFALFSAGSSAGGIENDYMSVFNARIDVDFDVPLPLHGNLAKTQALQTLRGFGQRAVFFNARAVFSIAADGSGIFDAAAHFDVQIK